MTDIWILKNNNYKINPEDHYEYLGFSSEAEAKASMNIGDELFKIDALNQEYLGTLKQELVK